MGLSRSIKKKAETRPERRSAAEERFASYSEKVSDVSTKTPEEIIHDLEIRLIELEIQNEDLKEARQISDELLVLYLNLFDLAPVGYFTLTDEARISQVNLAGADLIGIARKNLINEQFRQIVSPGSQEVWDQFFLSLLDQNTKQIGMINLRSIRGTAIPSRIEAIRINMGDGIYQIRIIVSNISDLKQTEQELRESEEQFRLLFKEAPIPYQSLDNDGRFLDMNDAWLAMLGYDRDEVIGHWFGDFIPLDQKDLFRERFPIFKKTGIVHNILFTMQKKNAEVILVSFEGKVAYNSDGSFRQTHCILQDITEKNRADDALRESEEKFRTLYTNMETGVFYQRADSTLIDCNPAALKLFGITREEFLSQTSMDPGGNVIQADGTPFPSDEHPSMVALLSGMPVRNVIAGIFHPIRQEYIWVSIDGIPQYRPGGIEPYQVFVTLNEITSQVETKEAIKASLVEKEILLREIHHRVKNNLSTIISLLNLQISSLSSEKEISHYRDLEARIRSMALVHESLYQSKNISHISILPYIKNLVLFLTQIYESQKDIQFRYPIEPLELPLDTVIPCGLVINEIITNALKYAFPPDFICNRDNPCTISIGFTIQEENYLLTIADNGIGMPTDNFDHPHTLGLSLIHFIISHQLRGKMEITAIGGTQYRITFPISRDNEGTLQ